jgi:predicted RNase H-like HicB family nuclease
LSKVGLLVRVGAYFSPAAPRLHSTGEGREDLYQDLKSSWQTITDELLLKNHKKTTREQTERRRHTSKTNGLLESQVGFVAILAGCDFQGSTKRNLHTAKETIMWT